MGDVVIFFLFPLYWTVTTSFKPPNEYYRMPPSLWPEKPTIYHYYESFIPWVLGTIKKAEQYWVEEAAGRAQPITPQLLNSVIITLASLILALAIGSPTAYALSRYKFKGSENIAFWILSTRMIPPIVAVIPIVALIVAKTGSKTDLDDVKVLEPRTPYIYDTGFRRLRIYFTFLLIFGLILVALIVFSYAYNELKVIITYYIGIYIFLALIGGAVYFSVLASKDGNRRETWAKLSLNENDD